MLAATIEDIVQTEARHTTSGILGIKFMLEALAQEGRGDVAVDMLMQNTFPSYGYMIKGGEHGFEPATTLWELWDSDTNGPNMCGAFTFDVILDHFSRGFQLCCLPCTRAVCGRYEVWKNGSF